MSSSLGEIMAMAQSGDAPGALRKIDAWLAQNPNDTQGKFVRALVYSQLGQHRAGIEALNHVLAARPDFQPAWYNLGVMLEVEGHRDEAISAYRKSLGLRPNDLPTLLNLGAACLATAHSAEGLAHFTKACQIDSGSPKAHIGYALALHRSGRSSEAKNHLKMLLDQSPMLTSGWEQLGLVHMETQDQESAAVAFEKALEQVPDSLTAGLHLARIRISQHRQSEAETLFATLASSHPRQPQVYVTWAAAAQKWGQLELANQHLESALSFAGDDSRVLFQCAAILSSRTDTSDLARAEELVEKSLALNPTLAEALDCQALLLTKRQAWDLSIEKSRKAVALVPDNPDFALTLASGLRGAGNLEEAVTVLEDALQFHAEDAQLNRQLGLGLLAQNRPAEALDRLDCCLAVNPADQRAIAHRSVALQNLGRVAASDDYTGIRDYIFDEVLAPPAGFQTLESFNLAFAQDIRNHSRLRWEPVGLAARHGALTDELLADKTPAILGFAAIHHAAVQRLMAALSGPPDHPFVRHMPSRYTINYWATLVEEGGNIDTHIHEESWLSGAYYVMLPAQMGANIENPEGWIEFGRPHLETPFSEDATLRLFQPAVGRLLMFPSYLFHRTLPFTGEGQRISVSFDLVPL